MDDLKKAHTWCQKHLQSQNENWELKPMKELRNALKNANQWMQYVTGLKKVLVLEKHISTTVDFFVWVWLVYEAFLCGKKYFLGNTENTDPKEKHCCVA